MNTSKLNNMKSVVVFHINNPDNEYRFSSYNDAARYIGVSRSAIFQALKRKSNTYMRNGWHVVHENTNKETIYSISENLSKKLKGKSHPSPYKGVTNRWTEEQKRKIGSYHKGKKISKEQIEITRMKNRYNSLCKYIVLVHQSNPNLKHTFHSISEASRQLNIPLPRLKSKCTRTLGVYGKDGWAVIELGNQGISNEDTKTEA